jgi:hypothetical protein
VRLYDRNAHCRHLRPIYHEIYQASGCRPMALPMASRLSGPVLPSWRRGDVLLQFGLLEAKTNQAVRLEGSPAVLEKLARNGRGSNCRS